MPVRREFAPAGALKREAPTFRCGEYVTNAFHPEVVRDPADMEAHIDLRVPGLPRQVIYYADSTELQFKLDAVQAAYPTLGGAAIWGIGGEDPANWDVLRQAKVGDCLMPER